MDLLTVVSINRLRLRACWQWCANGYNNSQQCWDLQCIVGRIQPISLCKPCIMSVRGPNRVGRPVQMDPTLLRYASAITEQKKCWELLVVGQQLPTLLDVKCCARLHTLLHVVGCCCVLLRKVWNRSNFSANNSKHFFWWERAYRQTFEAAVPPSCNYLAKHLSVRSLSVNQFCTWVTPGKFYGKWAVFCSFSKQK